MSDPCHDECKYHGFFRLIEWCRHPDHLEPLEPGRLFALMQSGGKCKSYIPWEAKVMPGEEPPWPMPVKLYEAFPQEPPKTCFCTHGVHNRETSPENDAKAA